MPLILNEDHYHEVIQQVKNAQRQVWIGTADIKDLHVEKGRGTVSFLDTLNTLAQQRVELRLLHAKKPGPRFASSYQKFPTLQKHMEMVLCPRVHFKMIVVDGVWAYFGSANLTGAGMGMKSPKNRNFETGYLTRDVGLIDQLMEQYDEVWRGAYCRDCGRREYCEDPIV